MKKIILASIFVLFMVSMISAGDIGKSEKGKKSGESSEKTDATTITWYSYDVGLELAKKKKKHILVDFTTKWCYYCKKMNKDVFSRPDIIKMLDENYISIKVDGDSKKELNIDGYKISERDLSKKEYRIRGYPAYWFLKPNSEKLGVLPGYQKPEIFMDVLYFMKEALYDNMKFDEYMKKGGRKSLNKG